METERLAGFLAETAARDIPEPVLTAARFAYLDWLGSALAGSTSEPAQIVSRLAEYFSGAPQATLVTTGERNSVPHAALVNGVSSHVVELDDVHKGGIIHAGAAVIPAALAVAEAEGASGRRLLCAVVLGYEAAIRIAEAITPSHYRLWHTTATCGTFGAAAAVGHLLNLDAEGMLLALGSAGTQASGLWEFIEDGAMSKHLHPGKAAMNGVLSAYLARDGFTAARKILEGRRGFFAATSTEVDISKLFDGLGEPDRYKILENSYKPHAACRHTHAAIDAALELRAGIGSGTSGIEAISVGTYRVALDITEDFSPDTVYSAKFSLPFCIALALTRGSAGLDDFGAHTLHDPEIRRLMGCTELRVDPELDRLHPARWPVRLQVRLADGLSREVTEHYPKGDPENPFTREDFETKFVRLAATRLAPAEVDRLIAAVYGASEDSPVADLVPRL